LQTFENREASDERRQTETGEERKQRKALKHGGHQVDSCRDKFKESEIK